MAQSACPPLGVELQPNINGTNTKSKAVSFILSIFGANGFGVKGCVILCSLACLARLAFPGDAPFLGDESMLLGRALADNASNHLTTHGLTGSRGTDYGPVPILFYRAILAFTHDPASIVVVKAVAVTLLSLTAVFWVLRLCPWLPFWTAAFVFLSPYFWFYARDLWDNTLNIPLTALAYASYLAFLRAHAIRFLALTGLFCTLALLIHLMALPICGAIALHFAWFERKWIRAHLFPLLILILFCAALMAPYALHLLTASQPPVPIPPGPGMLHVFFGLLGGRLFTAIGFEYFLGAYWYLHAGWLGALAMALTATPFFLTFVGMRDAYHFARAPGERRAASWIALAALALHLAMVFVQQLINHPHYYGAVWIVFFYFLALGCSRNTGLLPRAFQTAAVFGLALCLLTAIAFSHADRARTQAHYGEKIGEQVTRARTQCRPPLPATETPAGTLARLTCATNP
jgi:hypothetical protein